MIGGIEMIGFVNMFLSYLILVIAFVAVIIAGIFAGKAIRQNKDKKDALKSANEEN